METMKSLFYFITAGICEIGGGYLIWLWLREGKSLWYAFFGAVILIGKIKGQRPLAVVEAAEQLGSRVTGRVMPSGFDPQDIGSQPGEDSAAERTGPKGAEVDDPQPL